MKFMIRHGLITHDVLCVHSVLAAPELPNLLDWVRFLVDVLISSII